MRWGIACSVWTLALASGCRFYEPPKTVYTPEPEKALAPVGPEQGPKAPTSPGDGGAPPWTSPSTPQAGATPGVPPPAAQGQGAPSPQPGEPAAPPGGPSFPPEDPNVLKERLAAVAEALAKYTAEHDGKLPESGPGGVFRTALLPYLSDPALWPQGTMAVPRAISGQKLADLPDKANTPVVIAGPRGTDGKQYAVFGDLTVREVPEQPAPRQF